MISIKYTGPCHDASGYGQSNRADILALFFTGANVSVEPLYQTQFRAEYDIQEKVCRYLEGRDIPYKIQILHITPDLYPKYAEKNKYKIGRLVWETDKLPDEWVGPCNKMDEIWTTTQASADIIRKSGVNVPIYAFPEPIMVQEANEKITPFVTKHKKDFTFYSIFQWIDRKNARGLIEAYWKAFEKVSDVTLLIKTYRVNYDESEFRIIEGEINRWKSELRLSNYPKIYLVEKLLNQSDMRKLHLMGDCYINPSSGEGWCRPMVEAMLMGKPVISGDNGGATDILPDTFYYKVPSKTESVVAQPWIPWYQSTQHWKKLDEKSLIQAMKDVYKNYEDAEEVAKKAQNFVLDNFSLQTVGSQMIKRLEEINEKL